MCKYLFRMTRGDINVLKYIKPESVLFYLFVVLNIRIVFSNQSFMPWICLGALQGLFSSQGADLVVYQNNKRTKTLSLWQQQMVLRGHQEDICRFVVCGNHLISSSMDRTVRIWSLQNGKCEAILHGHSDGVYDVDGWGDIIVSGSRDKTVKVGTSRGERGWGKRSWGHDFTHR